MAEAALLRPGDAAWAEALARVPHDVYHLPDYVALSEGTPLAFRYDENGRTLLLPLMVRAVPDTDLHDAISPYGYPGPVGDDPDPAFWSRAARAMAELLGTYGVISAFVRVHPLLPVPLEALAATGTLVRHGETVSIDLSLSTDQMWSQTHRSHRNQINKARRAGVTVVFDEWDRFADWIDTYHATMRRVGATEFYFFTAGYFHRLRAALGEHAHLAVALREGEVLGGNLFFEYAGIMHTHLQSTRDGAIHWADKLLYDEVRRWGRERGNRLFHIGGGLGGSADSLFRFKAAFAEGRSPFHTWRVVTDQAAFEKLAGPVTPSSMTGRFPPYR